MSNQEIQEAATLRCQRPLAIAAPSFSVISETFIRDHVRTVLPGDTVVIAQEPEGVEELGVPALAPCPSWEPPTSLWDRIAKSGAARLRRHFYAGLRRADLERAMGFLETHQPAALLVEYLDHAAAFVDLSRATGTPLYAFAHGYEVAAAHRSPRLARQARRLFDAATGIFVATAFMKAKIVGLGCRPEQIDIAPYGVDPDFFSTTTAEPGRVLAVGRLVEKKAPHKTIQAFAQAARTHPGAHLDFVGDGDLMGRCASTVATEGVASSVTLHGAQGSNVVAQLMGRASIFVQHSVTAPNGDTEGLGVSLLEAMASAVPVVATRHNGFVETVVDGVTGILVEEHDVAGMADAIGSLLADPERARAMGAAGRARVLDRFTHARAAERLRAAMGFSCSVGVRA